MGVNLGLGAFLLLPVALLVQWAEPRIGILVYALVFVVAGVAGIAELLVVRRLPRPGRVLVASRRTGQRRRRPAPGGAGGTRHGAGGSPDGSGRWGERQVPVVGPAARELDRFLRVVTVAAFGAGFGPYLSIYAISVLGLPPAFAILLAALSSAAALVSATIVGGLLGRGSSSRFLRLSFLLRGGSMIFGLLALPQNPLAWLVLCIVAIVASAGAAAGTLAANERLMRLVAGPRRDPRPGPVRVGYRARDHCRAGRQRADPGRPAAGLSHICPPVHRVGADPVRDGDPGRRIRQLVVDHDAMAYRTPAPGPQGGEP